MSYFLPAEGELLSAYFYRRNLFLHGTHSQFFRKSPFWGGKFERALSFINFSQYQNDKYLTRLPYQKLLTNHTLVPILSPTSSIVLKKTSPAFNNNSPSTVFHYRYDDLDLYMPKYGKPDTFIRTYTACKECIKNQIQDKGFPWIKRDWFIGGINYCFDHKEYLSSIDLKNLYENPKKTLDDIGKYDRTPPLKELDQYHQFVEQVLRNNFPYFSAKVMSFLLKRAAKSSKTEEIIDYSLKIKGRVHTARFYAISNIINVIHEKDDYIPYELFWSIMSYSFKDFSHIKEIIESNTKREEVTTLTGKNHQKETIPLPSLNYLGERNIDKRQTELYF